MGDITKVNAVATTVFPKRPKSAGSTEMVDVENEDIMTFMAEYANGAIGQIACSRVATGRKNYLTYEIQAPRFCSLRSGAHGRSSGLLPV